MDERVLLSEVCREYFNLSEHIAQRKGSAGLLPVPAFRIAGTRRGPLFVLQSDLDAHVAKQYERAAKVNSAMRHAGLV